MGWHIQKTCCVKGVEGPLQEWYSVLHLKESNLLIFCNTEWNFLRSVKVKLSMCLTNSALCHRGIWGSGFIDPHFLNFTLVEVSGLLTPQAKSPQYPSHRGTWVGPRAVCTTWRIEHVDSTGTPTLTPWSSSQLLYQLCHPGSVLLRSMHIRINNINRDSPLQVGQLSLSQ